MFSNGNIAYENFTRALIRHRTWDMIGVMEDIAEYSMSYFDTAKNTGKHAPENFYHGLVLGLIVSMRKEYRIVSNRESGEGRYDIAIYPFDKTKDAYILEFKVLNEHREKTVQETAQNALKQIRTRNYEADLLAYGIPADHIYKLGFGFLGKKVWVVSDPPEKDEKDQVRSEWDNLAVPIKTILVIRSIIIRHAVNLTFASHLIIFKVFIIGGYFINKGSIR